MSCPIETHQFLTSWTTDFENSVSYNYKDKWINNTKSGYFGFIPKEATALFIGTFPVPEQRTSGFFYHSDVNLFWKILSKITGQDLSQLNFKLDWLLKSKIGITDILYEVQRTDKKCVGRSDNKLNDIRFNNLLYLFNDYPTITDIYLTSGGPISKSLSGKSAGGWLGSYLREVTGHNLKKMESNGATLVIKIHQIQKPLNLHFLITPAPQNNQLGKYLRDRKGIVSSLNSIKYLYEISDIKEKYKCLQWAISLFDHQSIVNNDFRREIEKQSFRNLLMECQ